MAGACEVTILMVGDFESSEKAITYKNELIALAQQADANSDAVVLPVPKGHQFSVSKAGLAFANIVSPDDANRVLQVAMSNASDYIFVISGFDNPDKVQQAIAMAAKQAVLKKEDLSIHVPPGTSITSIMGRWRDAYVVSPREAGGSEVRIEIQEPTAAGGAACRP